MYPQVRPKLTNRLDFLRLAMKNAAETDDVPLTAYSLLYCATVTENFPAMLDEFVELYGVELFFGVFLPQPDIDVKYHALGLLNNLLDFEKTTLAVINAKSFNLRELVDQCGCPYPAIQNRALDVIIKLMNFKEKADYVHKMFIRARGLEILFQLLNVFQWRDLHAKVQVALRIILQNPDHYQIFEDLNGIERLSHYVNFIIDDDLIAEDLRTLLVTVNNCEGRMILLRNNTMNVFIDVLNDGSEESKILACEGVRYLANEAIGVFQLSERDPSKILTTLMLDDDNSAELRCSSACTLSVVVKSSPVAKLQLSRRANFFELVKALQKPLKMTVDCACLVMETMSTILSVPARLKKILTLELTQNLLALIDDDGCPNTKKLPLLALEVLSWTLARQVGRDWFIGLGGVPRVMKKLYRTTDPEVLNSAGLLLRMAVERDATLADIFFKNGLVKWLVEYKHLWKKSPRLETALQTIFRYDLSLKLEYWGRLDVGDITADGFYCRRMDRNETNVNSSDIWREDACPMRPVYIVAMSVEVLPRREDSISLFPFENKDSRKEKDNPKTHKAPADHPQLSYYARRLVAMSHKKRLEQLETDTRLKEMYETLKQRFQEDYPETRTRRNKFTKRWIEERVGAIASVVHKALSGQYNKNECNFHNFELHIQELKQTLQSSLIPLGKLEVGLKLERALLFKVLADRLGVPCAMVRGLYAVAWIEVEVPPVPGDPYPDLPCQKMLTNHLVDLVFNPGRLVPLNTQEASIYCGQPMPGVIDRMPRHLVDRKPAWMMDTEDAEDPLRHIEIY
nr:armadillo repeat-containing protein 3 isoform X2 [Halyomorpha halys]